MIGGLMEFKYFNADITCTMISLACGQNKCATLHLLAMEIKGPPLSLVECCFVSKESLNHVHQ